MFSWMAKMEGLCGLYSSGDMDFVASFVLYGSKEKLSRLLRAQLEFDPLLSG